MRKFLEFDRGEKEHTIAVRVQSELYQALKELSRGSLSQYAREILIIHIRDQIEKGNYEH